MELACLGHWYVSTPIYLAPVLLIFGWIKIGDWRERRGKSTPPAGGERPAVSARS